MTEVEQNLELKKERKRVILAFRRLELNPDFQVFFQELERRRQSLRDLLEVAEDKQLSEVRGQLTALRGIMELFRLTINSEKSVDGEIKELQNAQAKIRKKV